MQNFYLGTHEPGWLRKVDFPLFVSHRRIIRKPMKLRPARCRWALDSGGFTELSMFGGWKTTVPEYVDAVARYDTEIGQLDFASPMDWMCEPPMLAKTGKTIEEHQELTVQNFLELSAAAPDLPFIPVLQGWALPDYERCVDLYKSAGVDLYVLPTVGIGTVCRRQHTQEIDDIVSALARTGLRLHGFGVKLTGLKAFAPYLASADSLAWSYNARRNPPMDGCTHVSCSNCIRWATRWREGVVKVLNQPRVEQMRMEWA